MTSEITRINRAEALRYMGYTEEPDARISAVIDECEAELLKEARPQFVWRVFNIMRAGHDLYLSDCSVGHADEIRVKIPQLIQRVVDNGNVIVLLGRENLEREHGSSVFEQFWYFHLSL